MANADFNLTNASPNSDPFVITSLTETSISILGGIQPGDSVRLEVLVTGAVYKTLGEPLNEFKDFYNVRLNEGTYRLTYLPSKTSNTCSVFVSPFTAPA